MAPAIPQASSARSRGGRESPPVSRQPPWLPKEPSSGWREGASHRGWECRRDLSTSALPQHGALGAGTEPSLYTVKALIILDNDGERLHAKYYDNTYSSTKEQRNFEKTIFSKTHKNDSEIAFLEGLTIIYKNSVDLYFYIVGSPQENELMLMAVLNCLFDSLSQMLRKNVEKKSLMENLDGVMLITDEIVDGGVILESDPQQVIHKLNFRTVSESAYGFVLFDYLTSSGNSDSRPPN
ncbi:coatomer subunit zeta-1-like isoform X2 [Narcine bancroftii]|uniref:coatomer subunit zeta-1-like isoform X2 n=1 Tax=Narcine bancroftii TaxID=1343680 RepID=UPI0038313881